MNQNRNPFTCGEEKKAEWELHRKKASRTINLALSDEDLRIVQSDIENPCEMLKRLDERFASASTA